MTYALGVDIGTTFSAAAVARGDRIDVVGLGDRSQTIPSVVVVRDDAEVLVGEAAERRFAVEPSRGAREFKRRLGDPVPLILGGSPYGAEALTSILLAAIVNRTAELEGEAPAMTAVTHPASWGPYKVDLLRGAVRQAGVGEHLYLTEPEAAAIHYSGRQRIAPGEVVAVYDLGGGTFDCAVLRRLGDGFEIIGTPEGIERLGGVDFDQAVLSHVQEATGDAVASLDPTSPDDAAAFARLREDCRLAKEALSGDTDAVIPVVLPRVRQQVRLTRGELEAMVRPRLRETLDALERTVASAGLAMDAVDRILLVGGSSRMPVINAMLREATGRPTVVDAHPKFAVASGAAIAAAARMQHEPVAAVAAPATVVQPQAPAPARAGVERYRTPLVVAALAAVVAVVAAVVILSGRSDGRGDGDGQEVATEDTATTTDSESEVTTTAAPARSNTTLAAGVDPCPDVSLGACITELRVDGDQLLAFYHVNFEPTLEPSPADLQDGTNHMHFFFDTTAPEDAGTQSSSPGQWRIWANPSPFGGPPQNNGDAGFVVADIPEGATKLCVLVADRGHAVEQGTGNCATFRREPGQVRVGVFNGGGPIGSAAGALAELADAGYTVLEPADADDVGETVVFAAPGFDFDALLVAAILGITNEPQALPSSPPSGTPPGEADIVIVLGPDFRREG